MGQVLTPALAGLDNAPDFPHAATMCGACAVACPVRIPLPDLMRRLREEQAGTGRVSWLNRGLTGMWSFCANRPALYGFVASVATRMLKMLGGKSGMIRRLPLMNNGWFAGRDLPSPPGRTFREMRRGLNLES